jgi:hypothetical protein
MRPEVLLFLTNKLDKHVSVSNQQSLNHISNVRKYKFSLNELTLLIWLKKK